MTIPLPIPIDVLPLFPVLDHQRQNVLRLLSLSDWQRPILARQGTVKNVAAHLLDGNLRTLSMLRAGHYGKVANEFDYAGIVAFLNRLNGAERRVDARCAPAKFCGAHRITGPVGRRVHGLPLHPGPVDADGVSSVVGRRSREEKLVSRGPRVLREMAPAAANKGKRTFA